MRPAIDTVCDALIVGGGPAGSSCARALRRAGLDVMVLDAAVFPRDKVCAGWITPQVMTALDLDVDEYRRGRTFQPISAFRVGVIDAAGGTDTVYGEQVSVGIRRCEFDHYLLQRSGARLQTGTPVASLARDGDGWLVNGTIRAPLLIGAGGHFCPVARHVNGSTGARSGAPVVVAQEAEFPVSADVAGGVNGESPELYFCRDFKGYGWCFRKGEYLNVGLGRLDRHSLPRATADFVEFLTAAGKLPRGVTPRWRGHAYAVYETPHRRVADAGVVLIGDAAALAYAQSGEGIRPAIESGLMAAAAIVEARGRYSRERLEPYAAALQARFGDGSLSRVSRVLSQMVPEDVGAALGRRLLAAPAFVRHVVLDRWFLHRHQPALG
jgi:flavin-dependent dehydrogenase